MFINPQFLFVLVTWLGTFYHWSILILLPLHLSEDCRLSPSSSQNSPVLTTAPIHPVWLLVNQHFIKQIQETNLYRVQDHCPTAQCHSFFKNIHTMKSFLFYSFFKFFYFWCFFLFYLPNPFPISSTPFAPFTLPLNLWD